MTRLTRHLSKTRAAVAILLSALPHTRCSKMAPAVHCRAAAATALLSLCVMQILARDLRSGAGSGDVPVVQCVANNCSQPCPPLPAVCPSEIIMNCGCCDVCWIYLDVDDTCYRAVPENVLCPDDMWCNPEGYCEAIPLTENASQR